MSYAIPHPHEPKCPVDAEEILEDNLQEGLDDDVVTDGSFVLGFFDEAWPRPTDNSLRLWQFDKQTM